MSPLKRAATPPAAVGVNFGDDAFYVGGFTLPEGNYALSFDVRMHAFTKQDGTKGQERLGVMVMAYPLIEDKNEISFGEPMPQFYGMGNKAALSFAPNPDTGKGLIAIPGAPASSLPRLTNWDVLRKSLYDCGLPQGIFTNDFTTIDGIWVHTQNMKAPEERKSFGSRTGEAEEEQRDTLVSVVTEILDGGKPWEGGGGLPEGAETAPPPKPAVVRRAAPAALRGRSAGDAAAPAVAAARPTARRAAAPAPPVEEEDNDQLILEAASNALTALLDKNPTGMKKLLLRTGAFKTLSADPDMAQAVMETHFANDEALNAVLGQLGFKIAGMEVVPA